MSSEIKNSKSAINDIVALIFTLTLIVGIVVCAICDVAVKDNFTWSLYPISVSIFAWLVLFPTIKFAGKGIIPSMIALTVLIVPFFYVLNHLVGTSEVLLPVSISMSAICVTYLWCMVLICKFLWKRKLLAMGIIVLLAAPTCFLVNFTLSKILTPLAGEFNAWDILSIILLVAMAAALFCFDFIKRKKENRNDN